MDIKIHLIVLILECYPYIYLTLYLSDNASLKTIEKQQQNKTIAIAGNLY